MIIMIKHLLLLMCVTATHAQTVRQLVCADNDTCNYMSMNCEVYRRPHPGQSKVGSTIYCLTDTQQQICNIKNSTCKIGKTDRNGAEVHDDGPSSSNPDGLTPYQRWCKKSQKIKLGSRAGIIPLLPARPIYGIFDMHSTNGAGIDRPQNLKISLFYHWRLLDQPFSLGIADSINCLYFKKYAREDDFKSARSSFAFVVDSSFPLTDDRKENLNVVANFDEHFRWLNDLGRFAYIPNTSPGPKRILQARLSRNESTTLHDGAAVYEVSRDAWQFGVDHLVNCFDERLDKCTTSCFRPFTDLERQLFNADISKKTPTSPNRTTIFIPALTNIKTIMSDLIFNADVNELIAESRKKVKVGTKLIIDNDTGSTTTSTIKHQEKFAKFTTYKNTWSQEFGLELSVNSSVPFLATGMFQKRVETSNVGQEQNEEELHHVVTEISVPPSTVLQAQVIMGVVEFVQHFRATITVTAEHPQLLQDLEVENVPATGLDIQSYLAHFRADIKTTILKVEPFSLVVATTGDVEAHYALGLQVTISCIPLDRC